MTVLKVTQVYKNLPIDLEIPVDDLVILAGPNNSGKSAILQYLNISGGFGEKADYISPRRFDVLNEVAIGLTFEQEQINQHNDRKSFRENVAGFKLQIRYADSLLSTMWRVTR